MQRNPATVGSVERYFIMGRNQPCARRASPADPCRTRTRRTGYGTSCMYEADVFRSISAVLPTTGSHRCASSRLSKAVHNARFPISCPAPDLFHGGSPQSPPTCIRHETFRRHKLSCMPSVAATSREVHAPHPAAGRALPPPGAKVPASPAAEDEFALCSP